MTFLINLFSHGSGTKNSFVLSSCKSLFKILTKLFFYTFNRRIMKSVKFNYLRTE